MIKSGIATTPTFLGIDNSLNLSIKDFFSEGFSSAGLSFVSSAGLSAVLVAVVGVIIYFVKKNK